jgi:hypothetical protein
MASQHTSLLFDTNKQYTLATDFERLRFTIMFAFGTGGGGAEKLYYIIYVRI